MLKLPFSALILGGKSNFGRRGKGLSFLGRAALEDIAHKCESLFEETIFIVKDRSSLEGVNVRSAKVHEDFFKDQGALASVYTGLCYSGTKASFVFPWDLPFIDEILIRELAELWEEGIDALCFEETGHALRPSPGIYSRSSRLLARTLLDTGEDRIGRFLEVALVKPLPFKREKIRIRSGKATIEDSYHCLRPNDEWVR